MACTGILQHLLFHGKMFLMPAPLHAQLLRVNISKTLLIYYSVTGFYSPISAPLTKEKLTMSTEQSLKKKEKKRWIHRLSSITPVGVKQIRPKYI